MIAKNSPSTAHTSAAVQHISKTLEMDLIRQGWTPEQAKVLLQKALAAKSVSALQTALKRIAELALIADLDEARAAALANSPSQDETGPQALSPAQHELFPADATSQTVLDSVFQFDQQLGALAQQPVSVWAQAAGSAVASDAAAAGAITAAPAAAGLTAGQIILGVAGAAAVAAGASGGKKAEPTPPAKPTVSLLNDTSGSGVSNTDKITSVGALVVTGQDSGATVEYKLNNGAWTSTFTPIQGENKVIVRQTKGGLSTSSDEFTFNYDTLAPSTDAVVMTADRTNKTVTLVFQESLDGTNKPSASDFLVSTMSGGSSSTNVVTTSGIKISGQSLTLTLTDAFTAGQISVIYTKGAGTLNVLQDVAGNDVGSFFSGVAADGYLRDASIFINGVDTGIKTQDDGTFFLSAAQATSGPITIKGGVNIDTGIANTVDLKAPAMDPANLNKPLLINPLTTLVQSVIEQAPVGTTITAATAASTVAASLGLSADTNLLTYDPISVLASDPTSTTALSAQKSAAQVVAIASLVAGSDATASGAVVSAIATRLSTAASTGSSVSLADSGTLSSILTSAASSNSAITTTLSSGAVASNLADAVSSISTATTLTSISSSQTKFLDTVAPLAKTVNVAATTNDTAPDITINFDNSDLTGKAAIEGDTVTLLDGGVKVGQTVTLTADHIAAGKVVITNATLSEGSHSLTAQLTDMAGNSSTTAAATTVAIDTQGPSVSIRALTDIPLVAGQANPTTLTFTFSEAVTGFTKDDITISAGTLGTLSSATALDGGAVQYTIGYTPPTTGTTLNVSVAANAYTDAAANNGAASNTLNLAIANPPQVVIKQVGGADSVVSSVAGDQVVSGLGDPSLLVTLYSGTTALGTTTANSSGAWSYTLTADNLVTLSQGADALTASQTKGSATGTSSAFNISVDTVAPTALVFAAIDTQINQADKAQTNGVIVNGTADGATAVQLTLTNGAASVSRSATVSGNNWTYTLTDADYKSLGQGTVTVSATAKDAVGNATTQSGPAITIDTVAPTLSGLALTAASDSGTKGDSRTNNATPSLQFTAESGSSIFVDTGTGYGSVALTTGTGALQTLTAPTLTEGDKTINIKAVDTAGNASVRSIKLTLDTAAPSVTTVTDATTASVTKDAITFTATFDEAVVGTVGTSSFTATNGTVTSVTQVGSTKAYTVVVTPTAGVANGNVALSLVGTGLTDAAGNAVASASLSSLDSQGVDTKAPAITTVTDATTASVTKDAITFTATFDEAVVGTVGASSFTATNGTVTSVTKVGSTNAYTVVVTPTAGLASGNVAISLVGTGLTDAAGNAVASASLSSLDSQGIDTKAPAITTVTDATTANVTKDAITFTATFDEAVVGTVTASSFTATNGTVTSVAQVGNTNVYTVVVTPTAGVASGNVALSLVGTDLTDATGNALASASLSSLDSQAIDTKAPAITTVTDATTASVTKDAITFTATFDEAVVGTVGTSSFTATNGTLSSVTQVGSTNVYTVVVSPTAGVASGNVSLSLVGTGLTDAAGNAVASASLSSLDSQGVDTKAPAITTVTDATTASVTKDAITFTATFDEAVVGTVGASSFTATNGAVTSVTQVGTTNAYTVVVTPTAGVASGNVALSLVGTGLSDATGNAVASVSLSSLDSQPVDTVSPTLASSTPADNGTEVLATTVTLTFNEPVKAGSGNIVITSAGATTQTISISTATVSSNGLTVTIPATLSPSLSYDVQVASGAILDTAGNPYAGITTAGGLNFTMASNPVVTITADDKLLKIGDTSLITFTLSQAPAASDAFTESDLNLSSGSLANFTKVSDTVYTASYTPAAGIASATLTVGVDANKFSNANALQNVAATPLVLTIDTVAPSAPTNVALTQDTGNSTDKITSNAAISATREQGATVEYSATGTSGWSATAPTPAQGANSVYVRQLDAAGNASAATAFSFTYDNEAAAPTLSLANDTGSNITDKITKIATLAPSGEQGATFEYSANGTSGWSATAPTAVQGANTVYARQTDITGNVSSASSALNFTFDSVIPSQSSSNAMTVSAGTDGLYNPTDTITFNFSESVSVSALTMASLGVSGAGGSLGNSTLTPVGGATDFASSFTLTLGSSATLLAGNTFTVAAGALVDKAGNASTAATTFTAPAVPSIDSIVSGYYPSTGTYAARSDVYPLSNGQILVVANVKPQSNANAIGFERWILIEGNNVVATKEFSQGLGPSVRFVDDVSGSIYFQTINGDLTATPPAQNVTKAVTLYAVTKSGIQAALLDTSDSSPLDTLALATGVTKVSDFSLAQLSSNRTVTAGQIGFVAFIVPDTAINLTDGSNIVVTGIYDSSSNSDTKFLNRFSSTGATVYSIALAKDNQLYLNDGKYALFTRTGTGTTDQAYHVNLVNGDQTEIPLSLYGSITETSLPSNLGTNAGDSLNGVTNYDNLFGFEGNDSITGSSGNSIITGGAGADTLIGGAGEDRFNYGAPSELQGDVITGTSTILSGTQTPSAQTGDNLGWDRIRLLTPGTYDFSTAASINFIDVIGVASPVGNSGSYTVKLTSAMAASADSNKDNTFGDIGFGGSVNDGTSTTQPSATSANITIDASALTALQSLFVLGEVGSGASTPFGGMNGNDSILGGAGADKILTGIGNDTMQSGLGNDSLLGGAGTDHLIYTSAAELIGDFISGTSSTWNISSTTGLMSVATGTTTVTATNASGNAALLATGADSTSVDHLDLVTAGIYSMSTAGGIAYIDQINLIGSTGSYSVTLTDAMASSADANSNGTLGDIRVVASQANGSATTLNANIDASSLTNARSLIVDSAPTMNGNDSITGGAGSDTIYGGAGADTLNGGLGADLIVGGAGADVIDLGGSSTAADTSIDILKLLSAADSTVASPDVISRFGSNDIINIADLFDYTSIAQNSYSANAAVKVQNFRVDPDVTGGFLVDLVANEALFSAYSAKEILVSASFESSQMSAFYLNTYPSSRFNLTVPGDDPLDPGSFGSITLTKSATAAFTATIPVNSVLATVGFTPKSLTDFNIHLNDIAATGSNTNATNSSLSTTYTLSNTALPLPLEGVLTNNTWTDHLITGVTNNQLTLSFDTTSVTGGDNQMHVTQTTAGHVVINYDSNSASSIYTAATIVLDGITQKLVASNFQIL